MRRDRSALLVVDIQYDFCTGGTLGVPESERVIAALNRYIASAEAHNVPVYATRDWHPATTSHFAAQGGIWPAHCVQHTRGAEFHADLHMPAAAFVVSKGTDSEHHGYSAFDGHTADGRSLLDHLRDRGISHLYVGGLATDYCVRQSSLDAVAAGFTVTVLGDAIAGIDVMPGDCARALSDIERAGGTIVASADAIE